MSNNKYNVKTKIDGQLKTKVKTADKKKIKVKETTSNINDVAIYDGGEF